MRLQCFVIGHRSPTLQIDESAAFACTVCCNIFQAYRRPLERRARVSLAREQIIRRKRGVNVARLSTVHVVHQLHIISYTARTIQTEVHNFQ